MTVLSVGANQQYATIAAAVAASHDGDTIQVQAGTYTNDFAEIKTKITLQGVGGMVHMVATGNIPNDKGILITDTDVTIDHFEFSGAKGPSGNDAGVRYQGGALTLTNDYFHDNQNGLLSNPAAGGTITITSSEFDHNGAGDGYTHNLYVGSIAKLSISDSYFHDAVVGHEIKSRAAETDITNTRIFDNKGTASYSVDLPNGGRGVLTGNTIEQGPNSQNPAIVAYGEEGGLLPNSSLTLSHNTVLNDLGKGTLLMDASNSPATLDATSVWNIADAQISSGSGVSVTGTTHLATEPALDTSHPFTSAASGGGGTTSTPLDVQQGFATQTANLMRASATDAAVQASTSPLYAQAQAEKAIAAQLDSGALSLADAQTALYHLVDGTTSVAEISYAFFTGRTPTAAGLNYLVHSSANPTDLNDGYYQQFTTENRYINFANNLATGQGAGAATFQASYGSLSLSDAVTKAYTAIFGVAPAAGKVDAILNAQVSNGLGGTETRAQYFADITGGSAASQKAAAIGFLLADSVKEGFGAYQQADLHFLQDLAHGTAGFNVDLLATYATAPSLVGQPVADPSLGG